MGMLCKLFVVKTVLASEGDLETCKKMQSTSFDNVTFNI